MPSFKIIFHVDLCRQALTEETDGSLNIGMINETNEDTGTTSKELALNSFELAIIENHLGI